jgi:hypothetical protein
MKEEFNKDIRSLKKKKKNQIEMLEKKFPSVK